MSKRILTLSMVLLLIVSLIGLVGCQSDHDHDHDHDHEADHDHDHDHDHGEYEWIGEFELAAGTYLLHFGASPDETMKVGFVKLGDNVTDLEHHASHLMVTEAEKIENDSTFDAKPDYVYELQMDPEHGHFHFNIAEDGRYAIITEHFPSENNLQVFDANKNEILPVAEHEADHDHDHDHDHEADHDHDHDHGEYEWIGEFELTAGTYLLHFGASPDETMKVGFVKLGDNVTDLEHHASHLMVLEADKIENDSTFDAKPDYVYELQMDPEHGHFHFNIAEDGRYAIITEHFPSENNLQVFDANKNEILPVAEHEAEHHHDH